MKKRGMLCMTLALSLALSLAGCAAENGQEGRGLSAARGSENGRTVVTMMYTAGLDGFEALVEATYPDIDLQVECNAEATIDGESERRLHNGHGTDIITTTMPTGDVRNYVMDLSAEPYVDRYQTSIFQNVSQDGKTLFIPLPGQFYGYIYNAILAERGGLPVPKNRMEILDMLDAAAAKGIGVGEDGTLFGVTSTMSTIATCLIANQVPDFLGLADGVIWNRKLLDGEASFSDGLSHCLDLAVQLTERGYLNAAALYLNPQNASLRSVNAIPLETRMLNGSMLMMYGSTRFLHLLNQSSEEYDFAILPFMGEGENMPWTIAVPDAYLAINAALAQPGQEVKRDACSRVLELLSTPEGQDAYIGDYGAGHSYLNAYKGSGEDIPEGLRGCIEGGYVYNIQLPAQPLNYFARQMMAVLNGKEELGAALAKVDEYFTNGDPETDYDQTLIGLVAEDLLYENYNVRREETALGNLVADAVREEAGTQFAFVNGGSIRGSFYAGNLFGSDLNAICPYENRIVTAEAEGAVIRAMLANGISAMESEIPGGRFLNVSGLCYSFRPSQGDRPAQLLEVTLPDGTPLDDSARYTIAVTDYMTGVSGYLDNNGDGFTMLNLFSGDMPKAEGLTLLEKTDRTFADALKDYFANHSGEVIASRCEGRIKVVTDND